MDTREIVYNSMVETACTGKTITYGDLAAQAGLDIEDSAGRAELIQIIADIGYGENAAGRPLLTAVVVRPEVPYPGKGFFILARELGFNHFDDERSYYEYELRRVFSFWKQQTPVFRTEHYMYAKGYEVRVG